MQPESDHDSTHQVLILDELELRIVVLLIVAEIDVDRVFFGRRGLSRFDRDRRVSRIPRRLSVHVHRSNCSRQYRDRDNQRQALINDIDVLPDRAFAVELVIIRRRISRRIIDIRRL